MDKKSIKCSRCNHPNNASQYKCFFCGNDLTMPQYNNAIICNRCKTKHSENICPKCGLLNDIKMHESNKNEAIYKTCFFCGNKISNDLDICSICGANQRQIDISDTNNKNTKRYILRDGTQFESNIWEIVGSTIMISGIFMLLAMIVIEAELSEIITSIIISLIGGCLYVFGLLMKKLGKK